MTILNDFNSVQATESVASMEVLIALPGEPARIFQAFLSFNQFLSAEMAELLSQATSDRAEDNQARVVRDKAYTLLKQAVDEVRECGQYIFWRDNERFKGYISQYFKSPKNRNTTDVDITPLEE